ncbi:MAG TPA: aquaporin [Patescibacteria group bacterium]|nr:aquaporin [Patescibacteria group bacterium]
MSGKKITAMVVAELVGTAILATVVYTMVARTSFPLFAALAAGATLGLLSITMDTDGTGVHLNPAVTLSMWTTKKSDTTRAIVTIAAQMLGGLGAWALLNYFLGHHLQSMAGKFQWKVLTAEAIGAGVFTFGVASATMQKLGRERAAIVSGVSLFLGIMVASIGSNAVINPAVAVGIQSWNWAYAGGPLIGGIIGVALYGLLFAPVPSKSKK